MKPIISIKEVKDSLAIYKKNDELYLKILSDAGISENDLLAGYYKNDPRGESEDLGIFESCLVAALENNAEKINAIVSTINNYLLNPDIFTFWKFAPFKIDLYKDDETLIEENITLNT